MKDYRIQICAANKQFNWLRISPLIDGYVTSFHEVSENPQRQRNWKNHIGLLCQLSHLWNNITLHLWLLFLYISPKVWTTPKWKQGQWINILNNKWPIFLLRFYSLFLILLITCVEIIEWLLVNDCLGIKFNY